MTTYKQAMAALNHIKENDDNWLMSPMKDLISSNELLKSTNCFSDDHIEYVRSIVDQLGSIPYIGPTLLNSIDLMFNYYTLGFLWLQIYSDRTVGLYYRNGNKVFEHHAEPLTIENIISLVNKYMNGKLYDEIINILGEEAFSEHENISREGIQQLTGED